MDIKEIMALAVLVFATMLTISIMWKFKRMRDRRKETDEKFNTLQDKLSKRFKEIDEDKARQKMREHPNYSHARFDPKNPDVLKPRKRDIAKTYASPTQSQTVGNNSVGIQSSGTTVVHDSSDLLTNVALWTLMNNNRVSSVSGTYDEDTGRVSVTTREEPETKREESSYSSTYSSSSDDDNDRKSSYSSSYSSSSSDDGYSSSYSSSSSDSSYSSD